MAGPARGSRSCHFGLREGGRVSASRARSKSSPAFASEVSGTLGRGGRHDVGRASASGAGDRFALKIFQHAAHRHWSVTPPLVARDRTTRQPCELMSVYCVRVGGGSDWQSMHLNCAMRPRP